MELLNKLFRLILCKRCPLHLKNKSLEAELERRIRENAILQQDLRFIENKYFESKQKVSWLTKQVERLRKENKQLRKIIRIRKVYKSRRVKKHIGGGDNDRPNSEQHGRTN